MRRSRSLFSQTPESLDRAIGWAGLGTYALAVMTEGKIRMFGVSKRREFALSGSDLARMAGRPRQRIVAAITELVRCNMLTRTSASHYAIVTDFTLWTWPDGSPRFDPTMLTFLSGAPETDTESVSPPDTESVPPLTQNPCHPDTHSVSPPDTECVSVETQNPCHPTTGSNDVSHEPKRRSVAPRVRAAERLETKKRENTKTPLHPPQGGDGVGDGGDEPFMPPTGPGERPDPIAAPAPVDGEHSEFLAWVETLGNASDPRRWVDWARDKVRYGIRAEVVWTALYRFVVCGEARHTRYLNKIVFDWGQQPVIAPPWKAAAPPALAPSSPAAPGAYAPHPTQHLSRSERSRLHAQHVLEQLKDLPI